MLSTARFSHDAILTSFDPAENAVSLNSAALPASLIGGALRWLDGPQSGTTTGIIALSNAALVVDIPLDTPPPIGSRALVREGCDRTLQTCATRFGNALNFQGEPFLPGNDLVTRYPSPVQ